MLELFLSSTLSCQQSDAIMLKIKLNESLPEYIRIELVETVKDYTKEWNKVEEMVPAEASQTAWWVWPLMTASNPADSGSRSNR